jgi:hypothetical protein
VPPFDGVKDIRSRFCPRPVLPPIHPLPFEPAKETLRRRVVGTTPHGAHAARNVVGGEEPLIVLRGKLTAPIRVENNRRAGRCQIAINTAYTTKWRSCRGLIDQPGIQIQHDAEIQPVLGGANVCDVGHPFGIGRDGREVPLQMVLRPGWRDARGLPPPPSPLGHALQAGPAHQPRHTMTATPLAA